MLSVGTLEPRKNLARVQQAARALAVPLRVIGAEGWGGVKVEGRAGRVSDEELAALYRGARCLVYPSLYEGFGHSGAGGDGVRDARRHVRGGATEEVAGDAAVLVDPRDVDAIAAGIDGGGSRAARSCAPRGWSARRRFSWDRVARETLAVYEGRRVSELVVIDADVLGRHRTGDETYVENLLRRLPAAGGRRVPFAAITRRPDLVPEGVEAVERPGALPGAADGCSACRGCFAAFAPRLRTSSTPCLPVGGARWS